MQVHDDPVSDPSVQLEHPPSVTPLKLDIPDQAIREASALLQRNIHLDLTDDLILYFLWPLVNTTFSQYEQISGFIVDQKEFNDNVLRLGKEAFLKLVKDSVKMNSWYELLHSEVFVKERSAGPPPKPLSEASVKATEQAWDAPFQGNVADVLLMTISSYLDRKRSVYARQTSIVNSSGTGKSRAVDQLARRVITVPMCLREVGTQGFPPSDAALLIWLTSLGVDQVVVARRLHGFIYSLLTVTYNYLEKITSKWADPEPLPVLSDSDLSQAERDEQALLVKVRQRMLAVAFRDSMTVGQSFKVGNPYRKGFFDEVIKIANKFEHEYVKAERKGDHPLYKYKGEGVLEAGKKLSRFIDPKQLLDPGRLASGPRHPLVILCFDESHVLTNTANNQGWTVFSELRRVLCELIHLPIFSLFLSTTGKVLAFSPAIQSDPSLRVQRIDSISPLHPISEMSFDDLTYPAMEDKIFISQVVEMDWMSHLGRPLFGSHYDALAEHGKDDEMIQFAKMKLLDARDQLTDQTVNGPGALACLSVRFALEFDLSNGDARNVAREHIERHMRLCVAATTGLETLITVAGSEPLLAEAAREVLDLTKMRPVRLLVNNSDLNCVDRGMRGELIAALLIMRARDASSSVTSRYVHVTDFIKALLPEGQYEVNLQNSRPHHLQDIDDTRTFEEIFKDYVMWFNHVIRIRETDLINVKHLWKFITRGAMVICANNQRGVDIVLPICDPSRTLSRRNVTAILVQVKNDKSYNAYTKTLFDAMDPFQVKLFSRDDSPLPVIRMVFALAAVNAGVTYSRVPEHRNHKGPFTAYDIWFAGLSEKTFDGIKDDVDSYKKLLTRSLQPNDAYTLDETKDDYLDDWTKKARGSLRRRLEPLTYFEPEHHHNHPLEQVDSTGASP